MLSSLLLLLPALRNQHSSFFPHVAPLSVLLIIRLFEARQDPLEIVEKRARAIQGIASPDPHARLCACHGRRPPCALRWPLRYCRFGLRRKLAPA
jgi:hypothetical protein